MAASAWQWFRSNHGRPHQLLEWACIREPPVDVMDLARRLNITLHSPTVEDPTWTAAAKVDAESAAIWYEPSLDQETLRIAIAWGIGHIMVMPFGSENLQQSFGGPQLAFALDLVLPANWFRLIGRHVSYDAASMGRRFGVEPDAVKSQAAHLSKRGLL